MVRILAEIEPDGQEDEIRAPLLRLEAGHGRPDAEFARLVIAGGDHAAPRAAAHRDRLSGQLGPFPHLDGGVKAIHVEMNDLAHAGRILTDLARCATGMELGRRDFAVKIKGR
jgi:hypothetical protein